LLIGPGLSNNESTAKLVRKLVVSVGCLMVIDADGLNALVGQTELLNARPGPTILTPHPGELGRLLGITAADVQADRLDAAEKASERWEVTIVLKGAGTVIAGDGCTYINPTGNPGMATAGTGDVLGGMTAGLAAQGLPPYPAAVLATYLHGYSGDLAAADLSELALTAGDLLDYLPAAITDLQHGRMEKDGGE
jgi:NAD(P)H-hydrate epimerase